RQRDLFARQPWRPELALDRSAEFGRGAFLCHELGGHRAERGEVLRHRQRQSDVDCQRSGYLYVGERGRGGYVGGDATHAWLQVYLPGAGWVEFDPTNGIVGNHDLIRVAVARDPRQAVPVSGTWTGFPSDHLGMTVEVEVEVSAETEANAGP